MSIKYFEIIDIYQQLLVDNVVKLTYIIKHNANTIFINNFYTL